MEFFGLRAPTARFQIASQLHPDPHRGLGQEVLVCTGTGTSKVVEVNFAPTWSPQDDHGTCIVANTTRVDAVGVPKDRLALDVLRVLPDERFTLPSPREAG